MFRLNRDGSNWVGPVLSYDKCVLLKDHNAVTLVRLEPAAPGLESSTQPLSHCAFFRQSEGNNFFTPNDILINLHMHHHTIAKYKFHENPSTACQLEKPLTFWKPKGNNSYIDQEIMTKLHLYYNIVTYT